MHNTTRSHSHEIQISSRKVMLNFMFASLQEGMEMPAVVPAPSLRKICGFSPGLGNRMRLRMYLVGLAIPSGVKGSGVELLA